MASIEQKIQQDIKTITPREISMPNYSPPAQDTYKKPVEKSRTPVCSPSFKPWSNSQASRPEPTNAQAHMKHIRELLVPVTSDDQGAWNDVSRRIVDSLVPEINISPNSTLTETNHGRQPPLNPNSKWRVVHDVFSSGAAPKEFEHPGMLQQQFHNLKW